MSDELKTIWVQLHGDTDNLMDEAKLKAMLMKKSNSIMENLKGSLRQRIWVQSFFAVLILGFGVYFAISNPQKPTGFWIMLMFSICFVLMGVNKGVAIVKINTFQRSVFPLKTSIDKTIQLLRQVWVLEGAVETFFASVCLCLMFYKKVRPTIWFENLSSDLKIVLMIITSCILMLLMYGAFRYIQRKRYGGFKDGLKECLGELKKGG